MPEKLIVPSHTSKTAAADLRQFLTILTRFRTPDETGIASMTLRGIAPPEEIAEVSVRRRDGRTFYTNRYRFFAGNNAEVSLHATRSTETISGGWQAAVLAIVRDALAAYKDYLGLLVADMTVLEHNVRLLDPTRT